MNRNTKRTPNKRYYAYVLIHDGKNSEELVYAGQTERAIQKRLREHFQYRSLTKKLTRREINRVNHVMFASFRTLEEAKEAETWLINLGKGTKCNVQKKGWKTSSWFDPDSVHLVDLDSSSLAELKRRSNKWRPWDEITALTERLSAVTPRNYAFNMANITALAANPITPGDAMASLKYMLWDIKNQALAEIKKRDDDLYQRPRKRRKDVFDKRCEEILFTTLHESVADEMDKEIFMQYYGLGQDRIGSVTSLAKQYGLKKPEVQQRINQSTQKVKEALERELKGGKTA